MSLIRHFLIVPLIILSSVVCFAERDSPYDSYCKSEELTPAQRKTLEALFKRIGVDAKKTPFEEEDCKKLQKSMVKQTSLAFGGTRTIETMSGPVKEQWSDGITDLSLLHYFPTLVRVDLDGNEGVDLAPLKDMPNLRELSFKRIKTVDLDTVSALKNLTYLDLRDSGVENLSALKDLKQLSKLGLSNTAVKRLSALGDAIKTLTVLVADDTSIEDWETLLSCEKLEYVTVKNSLFSDVAVLRNSRQTLRTLSISGDKQVKNLDPLSEFEAITSLGVSATGVTDLLPLTGLKNLEDLYAEDLAVTDLKPLKDLTHLRRLFLWNSKVKDLSALKNLKDLEWLNVVDTDVTRADVEALSELTHSHENSLGKTIQLHVEFGKRNPPFGLGVE